MTTIDRASADNTPMAPGRAAVRRVRPTDREPLARFYAGLSGASRRARFLGFQSRPSDEACHSFCALDHMHREGFVAVAGVHPEPLIVGHLCLEPAGPHHLELAVAVADAYQGRGIAKRLMEAALAWATERGFDAVVATAFADNSRVLKLLRVAPYQPHVTPADGGLVEVVIPLVPEPLPERELTLPAQGRARRLGARRRLAALEPCHVVWRSKAPVG